MLLKTKTRAPLYSTLSNLVVILDATGFKTNTTNDYGQLSGNSVQVWKSILPGSLTIDFTVQADGPAGTGLPGVWLDGFVQFGGAIHYERLIALSEWWFMHYRSPVTDLKWTVHMVLKIGKEANPNWVYGLFGNNSSSQGNRGVSASFDDRVTVNSNGLTTTITKGTAGFIVVGVPSDLITPNTPFVFTIETDMSLAAGSRQLYYIDGVLFPYSVSSPSTAVVDGNTIQMDLGSVGGTSGVFDLHGWISHFIIQSGVESSGVRAAFIESLLPYTRKKGNMIYNVDESRTYVQNTFLSESIYYLGVSVVRNPVSGNVLCVFGQWTSVGHAWHENNAAMFRKSTDNGHTFATKADAFNPGVGRGVLDVGFFYGDDGVGHGFAGTADGTGSTRTPGTSKLFYFSTADDGDNWSNQEITSIPADGLDATFPYGNGYQSDGYYFYPLYRQTDDFSASAIYVLRWPVGGDISTDLVWKLIYSGATYRNESSIGRTGTNSHVLVARDESTLEWRQYRTTDNWDNVTDDGDLTFGETNTVAGPVKIFPIDVIVNGIKTRILKCYYPVRGTAILKAIYANPANAGSGTAMWDLDTKEVIVDDTEIVHYGGAYHIDYGNGPSFNFLAVYTREVVASATSTLIYFNGPTNGYANVLSQLGL